MKVWRIHSPKKTRIKVCKSDKKRMVPRVNAPLMELGTFFVL